MDDVLKQLGSVHQSFIWANLIWGTVASGYMIYGWKQKMLIPFLGGLVMVALSCFTPALLMTLASIAIMFGVWWLVKEGY
ncbi:MAG TPA: hypothetical protein VGN23_12465 [Verrucomicrobiae bacterium]|jgi:hypothetical protein